MNKRVVTGIATTVLLLATLLGMVMLPAQAANKGDTWVSNDPTTPNGHEEVPHLDCTTIYIHGAALDASGTYVIDSWPGTGSGLQVWAGTWTTPVTGNVIASLSGPALVAAAVSLDHAVANRNQGFHFKLTVLQSGGVKHKVFWVDCPAPPAPHLSITKVADAVTVTAGSAVGFTVSVRNAGTGVATATAVTDPLPAAMGVSWSLSSGAPAGCSIAGAVPQVLTCTLGNLAPGDTVSFHVTSATAAGTAEVLPNTATVIAANFPAVSATATVTTVVPPPPPSPRLSIVKTADAVTVTAGSAVGFTVSVHNAGPGVATATMITDPLPAATGISWAISPTYSGPGTCAISGPAPGQLLICNVGNLAAGDGTSVHITSETDAATAVSLVNIATATATNAPAVTATATETTQEATAVLATVSEASNLDTPSNQAPVTVAAALTAPDAGPTTQVLGETFNGALPNTGSDVGGLALTALLLMVSGTVMNHLGRKRSSGQPPADH